MGKGLEFKSGQLREKRGEAAEELHGEIMGVLDRGKDGSPAQDFSDVLIDAWRDEEVGPEDNLNADEKKPSLLKRIKERLSRDKK